MIPSVTLGLWVAGVEPRCGVLRFTTPRLSHALPPLLPVRAGECNADANTTDYYACAFAPFITDWRSSFGVPDALFGFELLPAYVRDSTFSPASLPFERAAQLTALGLPNVVVSNAIDLGDPQAPHGRCVCVRGMWGVG